jgi:hypothetical protein
LGDFMDATLAVELNPPVRARFHGNQGGNQRFTIFLPHLLQGNHSAYVE